jgi:hypothetical protein
MILMFKLFIILWNAVVHFRIYLLMLGFLYGFFSLDKVFGQVAVLDKEMHHLRNGEKQEWEDFPQQPEGKQLVIHFDAQKNPGSQTLKIRQQDVRQKWHVRLNDHDLGQLVRDEKDMTLYLDIPPGALHSGENILHIGQNDTIPDDIWVGQIMVQAQPVSEVLSEATLQVEVVDGENNTSLPARITVTNAEGALQAVGALSDKNLAIRTGVVYTGNGNASFGLPAGSYTLYAGRGFEYGVDSLQLVLNPGDRISKQLTITQEVPTDGWVSSDTHIHTFTHSGHGDATVEERVLTIAGEGIELPIITDHNVHIDVGPITAPMQLHPYFTPVVGNEVTTGLGHFNIFPVNSEAPVPVTKVENWDMVSSNIGKTLDSGAIILNHARDNHSGFRPFGEERHIAIAGWNLEGWKIPANGMEVVNSGAQQTDMMRLFNDWFGMLNRGHFLTPVGASDSHDVSRYMVGQARTYIQSQSEGPGNIDVKEAVNNFRQGKVMVSFGLLAEIVVDDQYGPGDIVPASDEINVSVRVLGPSWVNAHHIKLFANGQIIREAAIAGEADDTPGVKWSGKWTLPRPEHDIFLVAIAEGPGISAPFWPIAKPYQPVSPLWIPSVIGSTGAVWIDGDRDGHRTSAYSYAKELLSSSKGDMGSLIEKLSSYDEAVAVQVAALLQENGRKLTGPDFTKFLQQATPATRSGFLKFIKTWQISQNNQ